jgi:hypothetical protein
MACANAAFLATLRDDVLTPRVVQRVVGRAPEVATAVADDPRRQRRPIQEALRRVETEIARYTDAVSRGEPLPSLLEALAPGSGGGAICRPSCRS